MTTTIYVAVYLISFTVFSVSAAEVYIINTKENNANVHRLSLSIDKESMSLNPVSPNDPARAIANQVLNVFKPFDNEPQRLKNPLAPYRYFGNMFGTPNIKTLIGKKSRKPYINEFESLQPFIKYLLSETPPNLKKSFFDQTRKEKPFSEDYIDIGDLSRVETRPNFSQDYIDLRYLRGGPTRLRRALKADKQALRSYSDSDENEENSSDDAKSKRFEVVKNKHNKKDIKSESESSEEESKKRKAKKGKKEELDSDQDFSELSDKEGSKSKKHGKKSKKKKVSEEEMKDEAVELYLQGNKMVMYPPMDKASDESSDDDTRRSGSRRMRMPYFLPKRYHWAQEDIPNLGYFFYNGPKGVSLED